MGLRLEIVSRHKESLGERSTKEFGQDGGTIGRSLESDWVLPDGQRYLSSRHAGIDYRSGSYYIIDTSTNGVYINGSDQPVGRGNPQRLFSNDRIRIGEYVMRVEIDDTDSTGEQLADAPHVDPVDEAMRVESAEAATHDLVGEHEMTGVGLDLLLDEDQSQALARSGTAPRRSGEFDVSDLSLEDTSETAFTRTRPDPSARRPATEAASPPGQPASPPAPAREPAAEARAEPKPGKARNHAAGRAAQGAAHSGGAKGRTPPAQGSGNAAFDAFLTGAGLPGRKLEPGEAEQIMHTLGRMLRETITGLTENLHLRAVQKSALRQSNTTIRPRENNPLKLKTGIDESLGSLLFERSSEYMPPVDAVRAAFKDIKLHQQALVRALYTAIDKYIERLEPDQVEEQFSNGRRGALLGAANKLKYWDYYKDLYLVVCQHPAGELPPQFLEELAQAYDAEIEKTEAPPVEERKAGVG